MIILVISALLFPSAIKAAGASLYLFDATPPREFKIQFERVGRVTGSRFFAYFSTDDLLSGISYYEVSTVDMSDPQAAANPFFTEAASPYRIPFEAGKYAILVRAYDNAGNFIESKSVLSIVSPFISYTEKGIRKLEKRIREMRGLEEEAKKQRERLIGRLE